MSSYDFSSIIQLSREDIVRATDYCIGRLTALTGIAPSRILEGGYRSEGSRLFSHRGEKFRTHFASRRHTTYCPACLLEDRDALGPSLGLRVGYVMWFFKPVRVGERHGQELVRRSYG